MDSIFLFTIGGRAVNFRGNTFPVFSTREKAEAYDASGGIGGMSAGISELSLIATEFRAANMIPESANVDLDPVLGKFTLIQPVSMLLK